MDIITAWDEHRRFALDLAFRMLGSFSDAEDVVQEVFSRMAPDIDTIDDVRGWLVVAVSRRSIDRLRSAKWRREAAHDPFADILVAEAKDVDPQDRIALDDQVRLALHVVLERLTPAERTSFVLHDVFGLSFDDIGGIVGRTPAACRQLASRARRQVQAAAGADRFTVETTEHRVLTERFIAACATGDIDALVAILDPDVAGQADLGGAIGLLPAVVGRENVLRRLMDFFGPGTETTLVTLPSVRKPTLAAFRHGAPFAVITMDIRDGVIDHFHSIVDPVKLERLAPLLGGR